MLDGDRGDSINSNIGENIESLVASGEILIISDANYRYFSDSLPVRLVGYSRGSSSIRVTDPTSAVSQQIFSGLNTTFPARISVDDRDQYAALTGSGYASQILEWDLALAYGRYGNGFGIVWMPSAIDPYIDRSMVSTINDRLIAYLGPAIVKITIVATTIVPANTTRVTTIPTAVHTTIPVESTSTPAITPLPTTAGATAVPQSLARSRSIHHL